jgi:hypothetical protein
VRPNGLGEFKIFIHLTESRTRDLPVCSKVPWPLRYAWTKSRDWFTLSTLCRQSVHRQGQGCQPYTPAEFYPPEGFLLVFPVRGCQTQGHTASERIRLIWGKKKNLLWNRTRFLLLVVQCLSKLRYSVLRLFAYNSETLVSDCTESTQNFSRPLSVVHHHHHHHQRFVD